MISRKIKNIAMFFNGDRGFAVFNKLKKNIRLF